MFTPTHSHVRDHDYHLRDFLTVIRIFKSRNISFEWCEGPDPLNEGETSRALKGQVPSQQPYEPVTHEDTTQQHQNRRDPLIQRTL